MSYLKKIFKCVLAIVLAVGTPAGLLYGISLTQINSTDQVKNALLTTTNGNMTALSNALNGVTASAITLNAPSITGGTITSSTITTPTLSGAVSGTYTLGSPAFSGTVTGTYTMGGTPTLSSPVLSGTVTGTYTLGGTPTISSPVLSGTATGTYTLGGTPSITAAGWTNWTVLTGNGWTMGQQTSCSVDPMGYIHLKGNAYTGGSSASSGVVGNLPAACYPSQTQNYVGWWTNGGNRYVQTFTISTGGVIQAERTDPYVNLYFDGIVYK